jgi:hypothetical protein
MGLLSIKKLTDDRHILIFLTMNFDDALRRYRLDRFTDADITRCSELSVRAWRELIKTGVVRTVQEGRGRGRVRLCDAVVFKRTAVIAALNRAALSLAVSGQIAYFLPFHVLLFTVCDPLTILFEHSEGIDPDSQLPARQERPKTDWFDPDKPARADPDTDWLIEIYDGRFVGCRYDTKSEPTIFGDLRDDHANFVAWYLSHRPSQVVGTAIERLAKELLPYHRFVDFIADFENPEKFRAELQQLHYRCERHDAESDALRIVAGTSVRSPTVKITVNVSLAIRKALRRYLEIEPA